MSLQAKILTSFGVLILLFCLPTAYSIQSSRVVRTICTELEAEVYPRLDGANRLLAALHRSREGLIGALSEMDEDLLEEAVRASQDFRGQLDVLRRKGADPRLDTIAERYEEFATEGLGAARQSMEGGSLVGLSDAVSQLATEADALQESLEDYHDEQYRSFTRNLAAVNQRSARSIAVVLGAFAGVLVLGTAMACLLAVYLARGVRGVARRIREISEGDADLTQRIDITSRDEVGDLATGFNQFADGLQALIGTAKEFTGQVAAVAESFSDSCGDMRTEINGQVHRASQVATAAEEMSSSMADVAQNCACAAEASRGATCTASEGTACIETAMGGFRQIAARMQQTTDQLTELNHETNQIGQIVVVIDDIADQTNLLALNAAIEAARAGEHGRGFSIVADEVRKLSERTISATRDIRSVISRVQARTSAAKEGMSANNQTMQDHISQAHSVGTALHDIVRKVEDTEAQIAQIVTAVGQQSAAAAQISTEMDAVNQSNRRTSGETDEILEGALRLAELGKGLGQILNRFRI